eukprot:jgi/Galph1/555/GphlegSOOS_G5316.1
MERHLGNIIYLRKYLPEREQGMFQYHWRKLIITLCCLILFGYYCVSWSRKVPVQAPSSVSRQGVHVVFSKSNNKWKEHKEKIVGVLLALAGNSFTSLSLCIQRRAHILQSPRNKHFLLSVQWWFGIVLMGLGELGNFSAFAFTSTSVIAPLGAWSVVLNAFFSFWILQEQLSSKMLLGMLFCIIGGVLLVIFGPNAGTEIDHLDYKALQSLLLRPSFILYLCFLLFALFFMAILCFYTYFGERYVVGYVSTCSLLGALIVMSSKTVAIMLRLTLEGRLWMFNPFFCICLLLLVILIPIQVLLINQALQRFGSSQVVPVYYVLFTLGSILSGAILFDELRNLPFRGLFFSLGIAQTFLGVYLIDTSVLSDDTSFRQKANDVYWNELQKLQSLDAYIRFRSFPGYHLSGSLKSGNWYRKDSDFELPTTNSIPEESEGSTSMKTGWNSRHYIIQRGSSTENKDVRNELGTVVLCGEHPPLIPIPDSTTKHIRKQVEEIRSRHRAASWTDIGGS